jgi:putative transcriptional regulator
MPIAVDIDVMLARRKMSVGELADRVGITPANLAVLKNGRAKAVRFATLAALCEALDCQPGDLLRWEPEDAAANDALRVVDGVGCSDGQAAVVGEDARAGGGSGRA